MAHFRFEVGTDTARVGIWDARFTAVSTGHDGLDAERAAEAGDLFYVNTHADGGGPLEIYVDEPVLPATLAKLRTVNRQFRLNLTSGKATVGGVEDFGRRERVISQDFKIIPGVYSVRFHEPDDELLDAASRPLPPLEGSPLERFLYRASQWSLGIGCLGFLFAAGSIFLAALAPAHWFVQLTGWSMAAGFLVALVLSRLPSTKRIAMQQQAARQVDEPPFVFELLTVGPQTELKGGYVSL